MIFDSQERMREKKMKISFSRKRNFRVKRKSEVSAIENRVLKKTVNSNESRMEKPKKNACRIRPCRHEIQKIFKVSLPSRIFSTGADLL